MSVRLRRLARVLDVVTTRDMLAFAAMPCQLRNPLNGGGLSTSRGARMASNSRRKAERAIGRELARRIIPWRPFPRQNEFAAIVLTRWSPKPFDDDNNAAALKSIRDGMAEAWGIDDADERITWLTDWRQGKQHVVEAALWVVPEVPFVSSVASGAVTTTLVGPPMPPPGRFVQDFDASDYERPARLRVTPNVIRAKGGA